MSCRVLPEVVREQREIRREYRGEAIVEYSFGHDNHHPSSAPVGLRYVTPSLDGRWATVTKAVPSGFDAIGNASGLAKDK